MSVKTSTPRWAAASFCVSPNSSLRRLIRSPRVWGDLNLGALSVTRTNGRKATRPCPCGYLGEPRCRCTPDQIAKYRAKLSGPFLDRIDLMIDVPTVPEADLAARGGGESSAVVRDRVVRAREAQIVRQGKPNALLGPDEIDRHCLPDCAGAQLLKQAMARLDLSARAYHRILKVARSIADLAGSQHIGGPHVAEAIHYRRGFS